MNFNSAILTSENPEKLVEFYNKVFKQDKPQWSGGRYFGWQVGTGHFIVGFHDKVKGANQNPERIMFNFEVEDVKGEFDRVKALGATVIKDPYHPSEDDSDPKTLIATLTDPDGNYFQLASPFKG